jgi:hypothetical protein
MTDHAFPPRLVLTAECPAGKRLLGGGHTIADSKADLVVYQSYPSTDAAWTVAAENTSELPRGVTSYALCAIVP